MNPVWPISLNVLEFMPSGEGKEASGHLGHFFSPGKI